MIGRTLVWTALVSSTAALGITPPQATQGYLGPAALALADAIGPPPAEDSAEGRAERAGYTVSLAGVGSSAWRRATGDRVESPPEMVARMRCATRVDLTPGRAPRIFALLFRAQADLVMPLRALKTRYARPRPYAGDDPAAPLCEAVPPERRAQSSPSYPSGHAAEAALSGFVLASLFPERAGEILRRARQYGDERVICRVHYPSDVRAGQDLAETLFARLQANSRFRRDWAAAAREANGLQVTADTASCDW